jgi:hypothetical protein
LLAAEAQLVVNMQPVEVVAELVEYFMVVLMSQLKLMLLL